MSDPASVVAETIQTASINTDPSPAHAASEKREVIETAPSEADSIPSDVVDPGRVIRSVARRHQFPPMPDLRFEQSYLASLKDADTKGKIAWITIRDQVLLPLIQGTLWTLALSGWRYWNRNASLSGKTLGSRLRRWWYEVNNWKLPSLNDRKIAGKMQNFYKGQFS